MAQAKQRNAEEQVMNQRAVTSNNGTVFSPSISGVTSFCEVNLRHHQSGVTVYAGSLGKFWVGIPGGPRKGGIRAIGHGCGTLEEAIELAATYTTGHEAKMDKAHAQALKANA
jgi:hypothetical protein